LRVQQPFMLPFTKANIVRRVNAHSVVASVRDAMREESFAAPIVVTTVPNACDYLAGLDAAAVVYYCVDDFAEWAGHLSKLIQRMEEHLMLHTDLVLATSTKLRDKLSGRGVPVHLLTHGVDFDLFSRPVSDEHPCLRDVPRPRAGYFGLIDERSNQALIAEVAERMPHFSFVLTGKVETAVAQLRAHANIHLTGAIPYEELPALVRGLDVLILPYTVNELAQSLSPLKLKEYLVSGKPVVSTPIPEAVRMAPLVRLAASPSEWEQALQSVLQEDLSKRRSTVMHALATETWAHKAEDFVAACREAVRLRSLRSTPA
jgi:glycosyltransferase involved in cell wall biosynthesis